MTTAGPYSIYMETKRGAGPAVAAALEGSDWWWDVLAGTLTDPSGVVLITENKLFQDLAMDRLKLFRDRYGKPEAKSSGSRFMSRAGTQRRM